MEAFGFPWVAHGKKNHSKSGLEKNDCPKLNLNHKIHLKNTALDDIEKADIFCSQIYIMPL